MEKEDESRIEIIARIATHIVHGLIGFAAWAALFFLGQMKMHRLMRDSWLGPEFPTAFFWSVGLLAALGMGIFGPMIYRYYSEDERGRGQLAKIKEKHRRP